MVNELITLHEAGFLDGLVADPDRAVGDSHARNRSAHRPDDWANVRGRGGLAVLIGRSLS
jgi:hypothetical protein